MKKKSEKELRNILLFIYFLEDIITQTPNDSELGATIRRYFNEVFKGDNNKNSFKNEKKI